MNKSTNLPMTTATAIKILWLVDGWSLNMPAADAAALLDIAHREYRCISDAVRNTLCAQDPAIRLHSVIRLVSGDVGNVIAIEWRGERGSFSYPEFVAEARVIWDFSLIPGILTPLLRNALINNMYRQILAEEDAQRKAHAETRAADFIKAHESTK